MPLRFQKWDIVVIAGVLLLAVLIFALFLPKDRAAYAEIYQNGQLLRRVDLTRDQSFTVEGTYINTVTVQGGRIAVTASTCPGCDCVHSGWAQTAGRSIVCLPNGLEIRVTGADGVDFVVG